MASDAASTAETGGPARSVAEWDSLWRPERWRTPPTNPQGTLVPVLGVLVLVAYANAIANEVLGPPWYVPFNVGILVAALVIARASDTTWTSMGMRPDRLRRGLVVGGLIAVGIVVGVAVVAAIPWTREVLDDERIAEGSLGLTVYHAFVRIPLGTALYEEVLFRGVLFGMLARRTTALRAAMWSSLLFGIWHVLPTIDALRANPIGDLFDIGPLGVIAGVVSTFVAGLVFVWLRCYGRSIVTPILVHIATNSTAILAGALVINGL